MSIASLKKVALLIPEDLTHNCLSSLQEWGQLSLIENDKTALTSESASDLDANVLSNSLKAVRYLLDSPIQRTQVQHLETPIDKLVEQVLQNQSCRLDLIQTMLKLKVRIKTIRPWGYFNWPTENHLGGQRLWFYRISPHQKQQISKNIQTHVVHEDLLHCWLIVVSSEEPEHDAIPFERIHVGQKTLAELETELESAQILLEDLEDERASMTRWINAIQADANKVANSLTLENAKKALIDHKKLIQINAWVESKNQSELEKELSKYKGVLVPLTTTKDETPPTLLKNPKSLQAAQKLVTFFQFPSYDDWDPTPVMHISFVIFYAMILADVGYGVITLGVGIWAHFRYQNAHDWSNLILQLGAASILYGVLVGSYFGLTPPDQSLAQFLQILDLNDFDQMMKISLVIGILHLAIGLLIKGRLKAGLERLQAFSWFWLLCCALPYLFEQKVLYLYAAMLSPTLWFYSALRYNQGVLNGLVILFSPLMQLSKLFGDILSYMRLFALGLASASLAITFNQLALDVRDAFPGMGILLSLLILLLGHTLNFSLAIMGGVVHSMRLNCIEFFNWALDKEGYPFKPFNKQEHN